MANSIAQSLHVNSDRYRTVVAGDPSDLDGGFYVTEDGLPIFWFASCGEARAKADQLNLDPLAEPEVDEVDDADRRWLASQNRDWHDPEPMCCGYTEFDCSLDFEAEREVERYFRPRARAMRFDVADEMARWGGHPG